MELREIIEKYISDYTCATMAERYGQVLYEQEEANKECLAKIKESGYSKEEVEKMLNEVGEERMKKGWGCWYNLDTDKIGK